MRRTNKATAKASVFRTRRGLLALLLVTLVMCSAIPVYATSETEVTEDASSVTDSIDESRTGRIYGEMIYEDAAVGGGTLTVYKVADIAWVVNEDASTEVSSDMIQSAGGGYGFVLTTEFSGSEIELDDISDSVLAQSLATYAEEQGMAGIEVIIEEDGSWSISDLELGLYLVTQTAAEAAYGYEPISPFLVSLPYYDESLGYLYEVDAQPKMEPLVPLIETSVPDPEPDTPTEKLPQTGQLNWPVPVMAFLGVVLLIIGHRLSRKDTYRLEESAV